MQQLILELLPKREGHAYAPFAVYLPTHTEGFFIQYHFAYEYSDTRDRYTPNSTTNVSNYRIREAYLVRVGEVGTQSVSCERVCRVLQKGEISLAIREDLPDTAHLLPGAEPVRRNDQCYAADFIGGLHGDERFRATSLIADGAALDLTAGAERVLRAEELLFSQDTTLYRWGTSSQSSFGIPVAEHTQRIRITAKGLQNRQRVRWLCDDFHARKNATFLQMFTMVREENGVNVCEKLDVFDENGRLLGRASTPPPVTAAYTVLHHRDTRTVSYGSDTSGITARVGFRIINDSLRVDDTWLHVRVPQNDNKWYASFSSPQNGHNPRCGEVWELELSAQIDYEAK